MDTQIMEASTLLKHLDELNESMNAILDTYNNGGTIYVCGNGGSASTASHMQNDFNKGISEYTEKKFNFYCLNDNVSTMMAVANDIGYEEVFRFPLRGKITSNDLFVGIIPDKFYSFRIDTKKYKGYIQEKLNINYEPMLTKITDLINGICNELNCE